MLCFCILFLQCLFWAFCLCIVCFAVVCFMFLFWALFYSAFVFNQISHTRKNGYTRGFRPQNLHFPPLRQSMLTSFDFQRCLPLEVPFGKMMLEKPGPQFKSKREREHLPKYSSAVAAAAAHIQMELCNFYQPERSSELMLWKGRTPRIWWTSHQVLLRGDYRLERKPALRSMWHRL